jgi:hypothetical protein
VKAAAAPRMDLTVRNIIAEISYRDLRVIQTDDKHLVGQEDAAGFRVREGFVVRDDFDDAVLPPGLSWFYSPYDAIGAIEMRDLILPAIKESQPATTLTYEYNLMMQYRYKFPRVYAALNSLQVMCDEAATFGDDTLKAEDVRKLLHNLRVDIGAKNGLK